MADKLFQIRSYLSYWLDAVDEHSLHSPFFFDLYTKVIKKQDHTKQFEHIEKLRDQLLKQNRTIQTKDYGAGKSTKKTISAIANTSLSTQKFSHLYLRLAQYFDAATVLELGTSLGINTLYLAEKKNASVTTFEGDPEIALIARTTFEFARSKNIQIIEGNIDTTLGSHLSSLRKIDLVFMDANHRLEPTLRYFEWFMPKIYEKSILIMDDIHYSAEMEKAWEHIRNHRLVYGTADLYRCGIVFFDPSLNKQHVILQF